MDNVWRNTMTIGNSAHINYFGGEAYLFGTDDVDQYTPSLPREREMSPSELRQYLKNIGGLASGEIVPIRHYERGVGQIASHRERVLNQDRHMHNVAASGNRAVVMYDSRGSVFMRVFDNHMRPRDVINIGRISQDNLPTNQRQRAVYTEARVRNLLGRAGMSIETDSRRTSRGPDIRPPDLQNRTNSRQRPTHQTRSSRLARPSFWVGNTRRNRFDDFM